jgi:D-alanine-D-alanine ligase-like ATP-grasp enzyme
LTYSVEQLPADVEQKVFQLVNQFSLQFSSMDFIVTPSGEYYLIEMNPNGQWFWLEPPTGLPMAEAMADLLAHPEEYRLC